MKPCWRNRKLIAWMALDALDARREAALRQHLGVCEGCRAYWMEVSSLKEQLTLAAPDPRIEASESFHRRAAEKLASVESRSVFSDVAAHLRIAMRTWRVALPGTAILVFAIFVLMAPRRSPVITVSSSPLGQTAESSLETVAPTIANYQIVASQSLDKLDELLSRQGNQKLPTPPALSPFGPVSYASLDPWRADTGL